MKYNYVIEKSSDGQYWEAVLESLDANEMSAKIAALRFGHGRLIEKATEKVLATFSKQDVEHDNEVIAEAASRKARWA